MANFKFHVLNDTFYSVDEEGMELADEAAVNAHARNIIAGLIGEEVKTGREPIHLAIMVDDQTGHRIANYRSFTKISVTRSPFDA
jgi:hypothetical protein